MTHAAMFLSPFVAFTKLVRAVLRCVSLGSAYFWDILQVFVMNGTES